MCALMSAGSQGSTLVYRTLGPIHNRIPGDTKSLDSVNACMVCSAPKGLEIKVQTWDYFMYRRGQDANSYVNQEAKSKAQVYCL